MNGGKDYFNLKKIMSKKNKQQNNTNEKSNVLLFPNKLNNGSILFLIVAYVVLIFAVGIMWLPTMDYVEVPSYSHNMGSDNVSVYLKVSSNVTIDSNKNKETTQTVTAYLNDGLTERDLLVHYEFSGLTTNGKMDYMYSGSRSNFDTVPQIHSLGAHKTTDGGEYQTLFGKVLYHETNEDGTATQNIVYRFKEPIIKLTKKEIKSDEVLKTEYKDILSFNVRIVNASDSNMYNAYTTISLKTEELKYHLDYQSYILTEDGDLYPLVGIYGYYYIGQKMITSTEKINSQLKPEYIIVKALYTDSTGKTTQIFYKEKIEVK